MPRFYFNFSLSYKLVKGDKIFWALDRHSVETVTLRKCVAEYEQMWKLIIKFLHKFQGRGIQISELIWFEYPNNWSSSTSYVPAIAKWRHRELSFYLRWACIYLSLVYIPWLCRPQALELH